MLVLQAYIYIFAKILIQIIMDLETLKLILALKEEVIILRRFMNDMALSLNECVRNDGSSHVFVPLILTDFDCKELSDSILSIILFVNNIKNQSDNSDNKQNNTDNSVNNIS